MTAHEEAKRQNFHRAICEVVGWRSDLLERTQAGLLTAAIMLHDEGTPWFGADDLPETLHVDAQETGGDARKANGLPGIAMNVLKDAGIIRRYFGTVEGAGILYGERLSKRVKRNGAHIRLWSLTSRPLAAAWLERHGFHVPHNKAQKELALC